MATTILRKEDDAGTNGGAGDLGLIGIPSTLETLGAAIVSHDAAARERSLTPAQSETCATLRGIAALIGGRR